ncbi:hypothetical protein SAMN05421770_103507 [Granulicella rosea]|uniref:CAAX prenyl protease 2/Lysostaphin resistance protein A-like domain-containing protein n=1 Tax=Granulicella rosea TaxID=474952 RepID=A0A239J9N2_9BACT|nr:hypothetical protein SAMN05421770_103507 [Granulicella rosea]
MPSSDAAQPIPRSYQFVLFCVGGAWYLASDTIAGRAARGISSRFGFGSLRGLLAGCFTLFLLVVGLRLLDWIATRDGSLATVAPLPRREGYGTEWGLGTAFGWGLAIAVVLPVMLTGHLVVNYVFNLSTFGALLTGIATLAVATLTQEIVFRGYLFLRLSGAIGPAWATLLLSIVFGFYLMQIPAIGSATPLFAVSILFGVLLFMAYRRTHALWLGWGLNFAYRAVVAILFGLPIAGRAEFSSIIDSDTTGSVRVSGGEFGPDAALLTIPIMLVALIVLYRLTREYAWKYTLPVIVAGGYEVTVAPPAAHTAMERQAAAAPPPLVQILATTPQTRSVEPPPMPFSPPPPPKPE